MFIILFLLVKLCSIETSNITSIEVDPHMTANGTKLDIDDVPYIVSVQNIIAGKDNEKVCTGFFIDPNWILTSARCFDGGKITKSLIKFGVNDYSLNKTDYIQAQKIIQHPDYNNRSLANDLALINVQLKDSQVNAVKYIHADTSGFRWNRNTLEGRNCMAIGYGQINYYDTQLHLMKLIVRYDPKACGCFVTNHELLCATEEASGSVKCFDDYGGPLVCNGLAVGVANQLLQCSEETVDDCSGETYYRYTNLCAYFGWIRKYVDSFPEKCFGYWQGTLSSSTYHYIPAVHIIIVSVLIISIL